ncbi:MAG: glycosyltransferase family 4 protein [Ignavibacteriales bacterium]|nr:glycosyltransferase family 4 protein [Ignavibacteriales bacterium]
MKAVIAANTSWYLQNFRGEIFRDLASAGTDVVALAPKDEWSPRFEELGARYVEIRMNRRGLNPFGDLLLLARLYRIYSKERPDVVLHNTIKPVIYGSLAAGFAGVGRIVNMISGLGFVFIGEGLVQRMLRPLVHRLYRRALRRSHTVLFQNPDDRKYFVDHRLVTEAKTVVIPGSGVDTDRFHYVGSPNDKSDCTFLFVGRILKDKGVLEFVEAARMTRESKPNARFQMLGKIDTDNPTHIEGSVVSSWVNDGLVEYLGEADDVRDILGRADVVVLPSYREGVPRSVLEGMAMGKAIITTDVPGCRETVENGRNGLLVPPRDADALAAAMKDMIAHPDRRAAMGKESRKLAEERFDVRNVNEQIFRAMGLTAHLQESVPAAAQNRNLK